MDTAPADAAAKEDCRKRTQRSQRHTITAILSHQIDRSRRGARGVSAKRAKNAKSAKNAKNSKSAKNSKIGCAEPRMNPARRSRNQSGVRGLVRAFGRRLVAVECGKMSNFAGPLDAALLWRQVTNATKAVTSHRTPNSWRLCAKFHHCSTNALLKFVFIRVHWWLHFSS